MRAVLLTFFAILLASPAAGADSYAVVNEDATETSRVVSVRIERRLSGADLGRIATAIKDAKADPKIRHTVVSFYLPRMPVTQRPWASVDTTPALKVVIGGLDVEDEKALAAEAAADRRALVGAWLTELPAVPGRISIYKEKGKIFLEQAPRGGQSSETEVKATRIAGGTRFDLQDGSGEHYLLTSSGELEHRSDDRLIAVAERVQLGKSATAVAARSQSVTTAAESDAESDAVSETVGDQTALAFAAPAVAPVKTQKAARSTKHVRVKRVRRDGGKRPSAVFVVDYMRPQIVQ